jgi:hypothetical protein
MPDLFDTRQVRDDPGHWDALAERVAAHAAGQSSQSGLAWFAQSRAGWIAASVLLAAAAAFIVLRPEDPGTPGLRTVWEQAFAPADDVGRALLASDGPPAIGVLRRGGQGGREK